MFYSILFKRNFILAFICLLRAYTYALLHNHQSENVAKMDYSEAFYDQILLYTFFILIVSAGGEHQKWSCGLKKKKSAITFYGGWGGGQHLLPIVLVRLSLMQPDSPDHWLLYIYSFHFHRHR